MVILNLKGGLGNQIFQYIAALSFASACNEKLHIYTGNLKAFKTRRNFSLDVFIKHSPIEVVLIDKNIFLFKKYVIEVMKKLNYFVITEKNFFSKPFPFVTLIDDYFIDSKFVDDKLMLNIKESLSKEFPNLLNKFSIKDGIGIHIRGTDRLTENPNVNYFEILKNISISVNQTLYCFTDDLDYAKFQLKDVKNTIVFLTKYNLSDIEEFYLISLMDKFIVSNSTFSVLARRISSNETTTYVVKDFFLNRDSALLDVFNFASNIYYL
jgi:hypothetical protein